MRAEVAERAIVRRVTMKDIMATDVRCVHAIIVPLTAVIQARKATSLAQVISPEKVAINLVLATIAKEVTSLAKAAIVQDTIVKEVISREKTAISLAPDTIAKVVISKEKAVTNLAKAVTIAVLALKATILMQSIA